MIADNALEDSASSFRSRCSLHGLFQLIVESGVFNDFVLSRLYRLGQIHDFRRHLSVPIHCPDVVYFHGRKVFLQGLQGRACLCVGDTQGVPALK